MSDRAVDETASSAPRMMGVLNEGVSPLKLLKCSIEPITVTLQSGFVLSSQRSVEAGCEERSSRELLRATQLQKPTHTVKT